MTTIKEERMDIQFIFKRIAKVLSIIWLALLLVLTICACAIVYREFRAYTDIHEINRPQLYMDLAKCLVGIAIFSIVLGSVIVFQLFEKGRKRIKKAAILSGIIFYAIVLSILFELTFSQYKYFPYIFFGFGFLLCICILLAVIPNGVISEVKCYIKTKRNGE
jgi:hypothetical protein